MFNNLNNSVAQGQTSVLAMNRVLRNTYLMLALTLLFSAVTAGISVVENASFVNIWLALAVFIGFPFVLQAFKNSAFGIVLTFIYTGFVGWYIGPVLNLYIHNFSNGSELIMMALGSTGLIFLILSAIALNPNRDFSSWGTFLFVGVIMAVIAAVVNIFIHLPALQLAISVIFALISGGYIMFETNQIVRGGETNYLVATVVLYVSIVNIFLTLLQILGMFGGNRN